MDRKMPTGSRPHVLGSKRFGTPNKIRTCDLLLRRQAATIYNVNKPVERSPDKAEAAILRQLD